MLKDNANVGSETLKTSTEPLVMGRYGSYPSFYYYSGFLDEIRITKGLARWTSGFTPPAFAHSPDGNDVLLIDGDETNSAFTDSTTTPHSITNNNVTYNASGQFSGAMSFNGSSSYLEIPDSDDWDFGSGDFTIDFWMNPNSSSISYLLDHTDGSKINKGWYFLLNDLNQVSFNVADGNGDWMLGTLVDSDALINGNWYHISVVRNGSNFNLYVNGVIKASTTSSTTTGNSSLSLDFGNNNGGENYYYGSRL